MAKTNDKQTAEAVKDVRRGVDEDGYTILPSGFPPFMVMDENDEVKFELLDVTSRSTTKKVKGKSETKTETYFRIVLEQDANARERTTKGPRRAFLAGETVTLNISGSLGHQFGRLALEREGKDPNDKELEPNYSVLKGGHFKVKRVADGKMGQGSPYPGQRVKQFQVGEKIAA